jgi:hypothetical protein
MHPSYFVIPNSNTLKRPKPNFRSGPQSASRIQHAVKIQFANVRTLAGCCLLSHESWEGIIGREEGL